MTVNPYESPTAIAAYVVEPLEGEVTVAYDVGLEDLVAFNVFHIFNSRKQRRLMTVAGVVTILIIESIVVAAWWSAQLTMPDALVGTMLLASAIVFPITAVVLPILQRRKAANTQLVEKLLRKQMKDLDFTGTFGERRLRLTPEVIEDWSPLRESRCQLACVQRVGVGPQHCFIYIAPNNAFLVPLRAFGSVYDFEAFVATLEKYTRKTAERWGTLKASPRA